MDKMLVAVFNTEPAAFEGLSALKDLDNSGDITLYGSAVLVKDASGNISVKQAADEGPLGFAVGSLVGGMVGLLGGPIGVAVVGSLGAATGALYDMSRSGVEIDYVDSVGQTLSAGKAAVVAEVQETWETPVDVKLAKLGGTVTRVPRYQVTEDQINREVEALNADLDQFEAELEQAHEENKAAVQKKIDATKQKLTATQKRAEANLAQAKSEMEAKNAALQAQMQGANEQQKARIQKRNAELKANYAARTAKLEQARKLAKEALKP
jgi:uncharacterized membrane protein